MKKLARLVMAIFLAVFMVACGGGSTSATSGDSKQDPIKMVKDLGSGNYEIQIDFSSLPAGKKFVKGQSKPNGPWVEYPVAESGLLCINNWPGGYFEFSFGTIDGAGVQHWADPIGQYVFPVDAVKDQQHFRVQLGSI